MQHVRRVVPNNNFTGYPANNFAGLNLSTFLVALNSGMRIRNFSPGSGSAEKKSDPDPTLIRNEKKYLYIYIRIYFPEWKYFVSQSS